MESENFNTISNAISIGNVSNGHLYLTNFHECVFSSLCLILEKMKM